MADAERPSRRRPTARPDRGQSDGAGARPRRVSPRREASTRPGAGELDAFGESVQTAAPEREAPEAGEVRREIVDDLPGGRSAGPPLQTDQPALLATLTGGASAAPVAVFFAMALLYGLQDSALWALQLDIRDFFGEVWPGFFVFGYSVAVALMIPAGYLADRLPRTGLMVYIAATWGLFTVATAITPVLPLIGGARFILALGLAMLPAMFAVLADYYPRERRAAVYTTVLVGFGIGLAFGQLVALPFGRYIFWQAPFLLYGLALIGVTALLVKLAQEGEPVRGVQERRALGVPEEMAQREDPPPGFTESFRLALNIKTIRRWLIAAMPFGFGALMLWQLKWWVYFERWEVTSTQFRWIDRVDLVLVLAGFILSGLLGHKLMQKRPGQIVRYLCYAGVACAASAAVFALAPILPVAILAGFAITFFISFLAGPIVFGGYFGSFLPFAAAPLPLALVSTLAPPRARAFTLGLSAVALGLGGFVSFFFATGAALTADLGQVRWWVLGSGGAMLLGSIIFAGATSLVEDDLEQEEAGAMASTRIRESRQAGERKMLMCRNVDVHYDDIQILFNVDFDVEEGEIIALLGTNGAGKSTLLRAISGLTLPTRGTIVFDFEDVTQMPAHERATRGISMMPGGRSLFPGLTVAENLKIAGWMYRRDDEYLRQASEQVLRFFPRLRERLTTEAGNLSGGEQQMLTLSQAFMSRPRILMIDELSLGLAPAIVAELLKIVEAIHEQGTTIVIVEQSVNVALTVAKRAVFMEKGEVRFSGPTEELLQRSDILRSVFLKGAGSVSGGVGSSSGEAKARRVAEKREVALDVRNIRKTYGGVAALNDISFTLEDGKVLGLIGPNGAGKTSLFDAITGFLDPDEGKVLLYGEDISELPPDERSKLGMQRSFQDARLFPALTVRENLAVALERHMESRSAAMAALWLPNVRKAESRLARRVERLIELVNLGELRDKFVRELSTGQRRLVDLACIMAADPRVVLLDEPSSGIAQAEAEELGPLLQRVKYETGCCMLIVEHDMPLIKFVSDELLALDLGTVVTRGLPDEVTDHQKVVESYLGGNESTIMRSGEFKRATPVKTTAT